MALVGKGIGLLGDAAKTGAGLLGDVKDLMFLHNTNPAKLARQESMGGLPMPSIAVTQKDIPFEGFGDITLVGKPSSFDPKASKLNEAFSADAYTVRAPRPLKIAKKGAGKAFDAKYANKLKELDVYSSEVISNLWDLEKKADARVEDYDNVVRWFEDRAQPLFLDEKGIKYSGGGSDLDKRRWEQNQIDEAKSSGAHQEWVNDKLDEFLNPDQWFVAGTKDSPSGRRNSVLKPYSADEVTKFMKKSAGRGGEGGMSTGSTGSLRASTTEQFKNLQGMRDMKGSLVSADDMAEFKVTTESLLYDLQDAFKSNYKYDADGYGYRDEFNEFVKLSETKGVKAAAEEIGFNPSKELVRELNEYKDMLRSGPTEYFESKPKRVVDFNEFSGAIIPKSTDAETRGLLKRYGIRTEEYTDEASNLAARNKFTSEMFTRPEAAIAGLLGAGAMMGSDDADAGVVGSLVKMLAKGKADGTVVNYPDELIESTPFELRKAIADHNESILGPEYRESFGDTTFYRGGGSERSELKDDVWMSSDPYQASTYAGQIGGNVMPLKVRKGDIPEVYSNSPEWNRIGLLDSSMKIPRNEYPEELGRVMFNSEQSPYAVTDTNKIAQFAKDEGFGGVGIKGLQDIGPYQRGSDLSKVRRAESLMLGDSTNARSINAAFDPAKAGSRNLLASNPVATTSAGLMANVTGQPSNMASYMQGNTDAYLTKEERQYLQNKQAFEGKFSNNDGWSRGDILPLSINEKTGETKFSTPEMIKGLLSALYDIGQTKNTKINNPASLLDLI